MAVLKDLIVHGTSRFLNTSYFNALKTNTIGADKGIFNKLIATDATIDDLDVEDLTAQNATVVGLLDVKGELHSNSWTNANIATIDGSFYITPTVSCASGTFAYNGTQITVTADTSSGQSFGIDNLYTSTTDGITTTYTTWPQYSKVLLTGEVQLTSTSEWMPLGTIKGQISSATTTSIVINSLSDNRGTTPIATLVALGSTSISNANFRNVKISLYERASNSTSFYPMGIYMTALGAKGKTFIDIYGGGNIKGSVITGGVDSGAMTSPVLRIGNLSGLPTLGSVTPAGWGIYTTNGFFTGTIVANAGKVGNWVIENGSSTYGGAIYTGSFGSDNGIFITPSYTSSTAIGGSSGSQNWTITASNKFGVTKTGYLYASKGKIAGWTIDTNDLSTGTAGSQSGIKFSNSTFTATINGASRQNLMMSIGSKFGVDRDGTLYANGANITNINANNISSNLLTAIQAVISNLSVLRADMGTITAGVIKHDTVGGSGGIWISAATDTSSNVTVGDSGAIKNWRLLVNNTFGVTSAGELYATSANISGTITATSGSIGGSVTIGGTAASTILTNITNAATTATKYITYIDATNGIRVYDGQSANNNVNYAQINSSGMQVYKSSTKVAEFGETIILGDENDQHILITTGNESTHSSAGTYIINSDGNAVASFLTSGIQIGKEGEPNVETTSQGTAFNGTNGEVAHIFSAGTFYETIENHGTSFDYDNTSVSTGSVNGDPIDFTIYSDVPQGTSISVNVKGSVLMTARRTFDETKTITYGTNSVQELAELSSGSNQVTYSLVYESPNRLYVKADYTGSYTILMGYVDIDSSYQRAVEGATYSFQKDGKHGLDARGMGAFEHGLDNLVSGDFSFASGRDNIVSGDSSCAFGEENEASGNRTFVFGIGLSRSNPGLTLGRYNLDTGSNAFVIGNGTPTSPSNAFEVWENGKVNAHGYTIDKTVSGNTHAAALQSWFNSEKDSIVRNSLIPVYSLAHGNGSLCLGYFLTGYDTSPYGGFFVCHYGYPRYVGIQGGTFTQYELTKTATSSRKTKENIKPMTEEEAKKLYDLNVISFDYKKKYEDGKKNQFGLIAEDCDDVIPYAVYKPDDSEDSIWGIDYVKFVPYLIKNLQLHEQKINELEKEIEFLKCEISKNRM